MFAKRIQLFRLFGIPLSIDLSWFLIAALITWSLAVSLFPMIYPDLSVQAHWGMGLAGAMGLFISIVLHELGHALVGRQFGIRTRGITLFIFGGVAELEDEMPSAKAEFLVAIAGPAVSLLLTAVFLGSFAVATSLPVAAGTLGYLAWINALLVAFNLVPAFPLDGGRVLRSALWGWRNDLRWATSVASSIGASFGILLMILAGLQLIMGNFVGAVWWFLIGLFLRNTAKGTYQQLLVNTALHGQSIDNIMVSDVKAVSPTLSIADFVSDYVYRYRFNSFPTVGEDGQLLGCAAVEQLKALPTEQWGEHTVAEITEPCTPDRVVEAHTDASDALAKMSRSNQSRLLVVDHNRLVGVVSLKDILNFLSLQLELGQRRPRAAA